MKAHIGLIALATALLAPAAGAQSLLATSNNGAPVASGAVATRVQFTVRDNGGNPRAGVTVRFEPQCMLRMRGEGGTYACVSALPGEVLDVVSDASGNLQSPQYRADGSDGTAWVMATATVDGRILSLPFYWSVGATLRNPMFMVSGNNQIVQTGLPAQLLVARILDDTGRAMVGVPVVFNSNCGTTSAPLPCLLPPAATAAPAKLSSDSSGTVDSGIRVANNVAGSYDVLLSIPGVAATINYRIMNVLPIRTATVKTLPGSDAFFRMTDAPAACSLTFIEPVLDSFAPPRPNKLAVPYGLIGLTISNCPTGAKVSFQLQHPGAFPEGSRIWSARPEWKPITTLNPLEGFWEFAVTDGGEGDSDGLANGKIELLMGVAWGDPAAPDFGDLWWVGPVENGWGISIIQHRDVLFAVIFGYDTTGQPTWYVMSGGSWNATRDTYTGAIYSPRGKPLDTHVAADFAVGAPVGSLALTFFDTMSARAIITLGGTSTLKYIKRQFFGVRDERVTGRFGDMWWAGQARNGWGLVLHQQYASLFAVMFTYGTDGKPVWFAMPSITRSANDLFEGVAYRPMGSTWPANYDPQQHSTRSVGFFKIEFGNSNAATLDFTVDGKSNRFSLSRLPF